MNDFGAHQFQTWRQVDVFQNSNNFAEVGWYTEEGQDQKAHPYKTYFNNGVGGTVGFSGLDISPRDRVHTFTVKDSDDDNIYTFALDGNQLGVQNTVTIAAGQAVENAESERSCTSDSLWAQFRHLRVLDNPNGNWDNWSGMTNIVNTQANPYKYCPINDQSFDVKQVC